MRHTHFLVSVAASLISPGAAAQQPLPPTYDSVAEILQTSGTSGSGFYRYGFPRRDLKVRVGDVEVAPGLALGSWAGFYGTPARGAVMGDMVLATDELAPVLRELARQGVQVTAIHNHLAGETPQVTYVHFHASGSATDLARRVNAALNHTGTPRPVKAGTKSARTAELEEVFRGLGQSGQAEGDVAKVSFNLVRERVTVAGESPPAGLAFNSPINVQLLAGRRVVATGDFALTEGKVQPILEVLAKHAITATAVHTHLIGEIPRIYYIHFWADGVRDRVLRGLRAAVDAAQ